MSALCGGKPILPECLANVIMAFCQFDALFDFQPACFVVEDSP
jgi:hypothetical protein